MTTLQRILAFVVCLLMMTGAAINTNKSILGNDLTKTIEKTDSTTSKAEIYHLDEAGNSVIETSSLTDITGYSGKTPLKITISKDGVIENIEALPNTETPGFFKRASALLDDWKGKSVNDALTMEVDAVSGATMSSGAIKENMRQGLQFYLDEIGSKSVIEENSGSMPLRFWFALAVTLAACVLPLFIKNKTYHLVQMCLNVAVLGFWCGEFISYGHLVNYLSSGIGIWKGIIPILMMIAAFVYPVFGKRQHYCSHICPLGSLQQLAGMCSTHKITMSHKLTHALEWFRRILWAVLMFCLWIPVMTEWMDYELFSAFLVESASTLILICGAAVAILSIFIPRPYCRFICPTGTLMKIQENMFTDHKF